MNIEVSLNTLGDNDWWFDLGISIDKTEYHPTHRYVLTLGLAFFSIYFRFIRRKK